MTKEFVERRDGSLYLVGSRVPLAHIVLEFQHGESPEAIRSHYPTLSLEQVYGAIAFSLGSKEEVAADIAEPSSNSASTKGFPAIPPRMASFFRTTPSQPSPTASCAIPKHSSFNASYPTALINGSATPKPEPDVAHALLRAAFTLV